MDCKLDNTTTTTATATATTKSTPTFFETMTTNNNTTTTTSAAAAPAVNENTNNNNNNNNKKPQNTNNNNKKPQVTFTEEQTQSVCTEYKLTENELQTFSAQDPVNNNQLQGFVVKDSSDFIILRINSVDLIQSQYVHVVPKLKKYFPNLLSDVKFNRYYIANKWNGMNIQVFKYFDNDGNLFVGCRPRTSYFLQNDKKGNILDSVNNVFANDSKLDDSFKSATFKDGCPSLLRELLSNDNCRSMAFELCGSKLPHIVKYDFDLDLKPLMTISTNGSVSPVLSGSNIITTEAPITLADLSTTVNEIKSNLLNINQEYRRANNLQENSYWFNHFLEEGRVLYVLNDKDQLVVPNNIFSIKPSDCDKFHWEQFDSGIQTKVLMICKELKEKGSPVNKTTLQSELELDQFTWAKWEDDILDLAILPEFDSANKASASAAASKKKGQSAPGSSTPPPPQINNENQRLLITVGFPASGKSYFASALAKRGWKRVNQDELGTRKKCEDNLIQYLKRGESVIVDRCNFDILQRRSWLKIATQYGVKNIHLLWFKIDADICKKRIVVREDHPTIPKGNEGIEIIQKFQTMFVDPSEAEGYSIIESINSEEESNLAIERFAQMVSSSSSLSATSSESSTESNISAGLSSLTIEAAN